MTDLAKATHRATLVLALLFVSESILLGIAPHDRAVWLLENALVVPFALALMASYRSFRLSLVSYFLIFIFLSLHEIGAHYTYAKVPYRLWFDLAPAGVARNHFDRIVHFSYGLLLAYPIREVFLRIAQVRGFWGYFLPMDLTMSTSMLFELIEWGVAVQFGGTGVDYLATQGDPWDAQKDMALASLGALVAMLVAAAINVYFRRDFWREWRRSLSVKYRRPLGENALRRMLRRK